MSPDVNFMNKKVAASSFPVLLMISERSVMEDGWLKDVHDTQLIVVVSNTADVTPRHRKCDADSSGRWRRVPQHRRHFLWLRSHPAPDWLLTSRHQVPADVPVYTGGSEVKRAQGVVTGPLICSDIISNTLSRRHHQTTSQAQTNFWCRTKILRVFLESWCVWCLSLFLVMTFR